MFPWSAWLVSTELSRCYGMGELPNRLKASRHGVVGPQIPGGIPLLGPAPGVHPVLVEAQSLCAMALALCLVGSLDPAWLPPRCSTLPQLTSYVEVGV